MRLFTSRLGNDANNAGAFGIRSVAQPGTTLEVFLAGLPTIPGWLAKNHTTRWRLPASSTGAFDQIWEVGSDNVRHRQQWLADGTWRILLNGSVQVDITPRAALRGFKRDTLVAVGNVNLTVAQSGRLISNFGIGGGVQYNLPSANAAAVGTYYIVHIDAAQQVTIEPNGTDAFVGNGAGEYMRSNTLGSWAEVTCVAVGVWSFRRGGTWTDEP